MTLELITLRFYHGGVIMIGKRYTRGNHIMGYEPGQCVM
ncbi:hypothetical protein RDI58_020122 [Solanum bulbocastanum]|uniref:Uncharacterized protein n=1 Tax=Solanum bulbocastanum TaxID=147425 RepID=A0AAN8TBH3_SOLBU